MIYSGRPAGQETLKTTTWAYTTDGVDVAADADDDDDGRMAKGRERGGGGRKGRW